MKIVNKRALLLLIVFLLVVSLLPVQALAAEAIDPTRDVKITIQYTYGGKAIPNAEFGLYYVASVSPYGEFTLTGDFKDYPVSLDGLDADGWNTLAQTLYGYAQRDNLKQHDWGVTDANGSVSFPAKSSSMKPGLYLVAGKTTTAGGYAYKTAPFIVCAPAEDLQQNAWNYSITVNPKASQEEYHDTITRKVLKVWDDKGNETERPNEIIVQLLKDGKVYDTVTLNKDNNWRYTWSSLDDRYEWLVTEKEPSGYTVKTELRGITFVITNTYSPDTPVGETITRKVHKVWDDKGYENKRPQYVTVTLLKNGEEYDTQRITAAGNWEYAWADLPRYDADGKEITWSIREGYISGYVANVAQNGNSFVLTNSIDKDKLPQTGMLWWPVPLMATVGLAFLLLGAIFKKRENNG